MGRNIRLTTADAVSLDAVVEGPPSGLYRGVVILVHGISADLEEDGQFGPLAHELAGQGFVCVRFSFRGHGRSDGEPQQVTIAGEVLDLQAVLGYARATFPGSLSIVAASFGAVSTVLLLSQSEASLASLVLWYPVLDTRRTFLESELPWGLENFEVRREAIERDGYLVMNGWFRVGRALYQEFDQHDIVGHLMANPLPTLVVHGDKDSCVSYDLARSMAQERPSTAFVTIRGSEHGFDASGHRNAAIRVTADWLVDHHPIRLDTQ